MLHEPHCHTPELSHHTVTLTHYTITHTHTHTHTHYTNGYLCCGYTAGELPSMSHHQLHVRPNHLLQFFKTVVLGHYLKEVDGRWRELHSAQKFIHSCELLLCLHHWVQDEVQHSRLLSNQILLLRNNNYYYYYC